MKKKNNKSQFYQTAGIFFVILAAFELSYLLSNQTFGYILTTAGYALIAIPLLTKKKNVLSVVGFGLLAIDAVYRGIIYIHVLNVVLSVLDLAAFLIMAYILKVWANAPGTLKKEQTKKMRFLPSILTMIRGVMWFAAVPILYGYGATAQFSSLLWTAFTALAMYYAAVGIMHLEDAPAAEPSCAAENVEPDDSASEELKAYKSLLDNGIISQEEYDAKREELGL